MPISIAHRAQRLPHAQRHLPGIMACESPFSQRTERCVYSAREPIFTAPGDNTGRGLHATRTKGLSDPVDTTFLSKPQPHLVPHADCLAVDSGRLSKSEPANSNSPKSTCKEQRLRFSSTQNRAKVNRDNKPLALGSSSPHESPLFS